MTMLVGATLVFALLFVIMAVVALKLARGNRARSIARIQALQALAAPPREDALRAELHPDEGWDLSLRSEAPPAAVRSSNFEVRSSAPSSASRASDHPLFEEAERAPNKRWPLMAAVVVIMAAGGGVFYIVSSGIIGRVVTANSARASQSAAAVTAAAPVELLSLRHVVETPGTFVVTGLVQNPAAGASLRGVFAMVYLFDAEGRYFASSRAALDATVLSNGGQAAFTVRVPASTDVSRYRVSFQLEDGTAVNHVDRRGTLPEGTTGDAISASTKDSR